MTSVRYGSKILKVELLLLNFKPYSLPDLYFLVWHLEMIRISPSTLNL